MRLQDVKVVLSLLQVLTVFLAMCIFAKVWTSLATVRAAKAVAGDRRAKSYQENGYASQN
jgi:hypothetical protein